MIPFDDFGGEGPNLHFAHANGYPPGAYRLLLDRLEARFHVIAMHSRPLWPGSDPSSIQDWKPFADDLDTFLTEHCLTGLIGVGHSIGATTTLRLALRQPDRFKALVLIDPVLFLPRAIVLWKMVYWLGLASTMNPLIVATLRRRRFFETKQAMVANYRSKPIFQAMDDRALQNYVDALARPRPDGGVELAYPPEWEAHIYATGMLSELDIWRSLPTLRPPVLFIRGAKSHLFQAQNIRRLQLALPNLREASIPDGTHLVALEKPDQVWQATANFLDTVA